MEQSRTFYEFFAGGGLARTGLGPAWTCLFANDISPKKAATYRANFGPAPELLVEDIRAVATEHIPGTATLAWASFPCQDLSLAGQGAGLQAERSGTFWPFWQLVTAVARQGRDIPIIVLENVVGLLSSKQGQDFQDLLQVLVDSGYRPGAVMLDAVHFVPQSRPRLFIVAVKAEHSIPAGLIDPLPEPQAWRPRALLNAYQRLPPSIKHAWVWWHLPPPPTRTTQLCDCIEQDPPDVAWHSQAETDYLLSLMSAGNLAKVRQAQRSGEPHIGTIYKRIRLEQGVRRQRAEIRFDGISGCLRTPSGGSSRQSIMLINGDSRRSRLLSVREAARLMGLPDTYRIPAKYNDGYHVMGDGVAVPVVAWLEQHILQPLATARSMNAVLNDS